MYKIFICFLNVIEKKKREEVICITYNTSHSYLALKNSLQLLILCFKSYYRYTCNFPQRLEFRLISRIRVLLSKKLKEQKFPPLLWLNYCLYKVSMPHIYVTRVNITSSLYLLYPRTITVP